MMSTFEHFPQNEILLDYRFLKNTKNLNLENNNSKTTY